jgi:SulP family sulfate permease
MRRDRSGEVTGDAGQTPEGLPEINLPGLGELREVVANYARQQLPRRATVGQDGLAGLNSALASVPDGLASGVLAGVNPIYGLYACLFGPIAGSLFSGTQLMLITTTSASALAAGQTLAGLPPEARDRALFVMVLLIGAFLIVFGLLRLGRYTRFVSYSVMMGFLTGIAVLTVLSQLPTVTGYAPDSGNRVAATVDLLFHLDEVHLVTAGVAALTLALTILLPRTPLGNFGTFIAIVVPSLLVALLAPGVVALVRDEGTIPRGLPAPFVPSPADLSPNLIAGALAVAVIILVQGAGVSQSVPNPDGSPRSMSRDFIGQGMANLASGLMRGLPVGGSLSTTALSMVSGARTRWAAIFAGVWMAVIVLAFPTLVGYVAMPSLGAVLIYASARAIKPAEAVSIWQTGWPSRLGMVTTFLATLFLPVEAAVGLGVVLSALLYLNEASTDVSVVALVKRPDGRIQERTAPRQLPSNQVTVLDVYGHLFYAGARTLARQLPRPDDAENPAVVLRLRGRRHVGATLVEVLSNYANKLSEVNGRLYLAGVSSEAHDQITRTAKLRLTGPVRVYEATDVRGEATHQAVEAAGAWLVQQMDGGGNDKENTPGRGAASEPGSGEG